MNGHCYIMFEAKCSNILLLQISPLILTKQKVAQGYNFLFRPSRGRYLWRTWMTVNRGFDVTVLEETLNITLLQILQYAYTLLSLPIVEKKVRLHISIKHTEQKWDFFFWQLIKPNQVYFIKSKFEYILYLSLWYKILESIYHFWTY